MCEVNVCEGDDGRHAGARSRVSESECNGEVCESRDTREFERVDCMETKTATFEGQRPSSGRSCIGGRAGLAQQRARGSDRAWHEAATCSLAGVKPGPGTPAVNVADTATDKR